MLVRSAVEMYWRSMEVLLHTLKVF